MRGVPRILIDLQLGHKAPARDAAFGIAVSLVESRVGRDHYFDAAAVSADFVRRVPEAIRAVLSEAEQALA